MLRKVVAKSLKGGAKEGIWQLLRKVVAMEDGCYIKWFIQKVIAKEDG